MKRAESHKTGRSNSDSSASSGASGSKKSSKSKTPSSGHSHMVAQQLAIPYGDTEVLKGWLRQKYGVNFRIKAYQIGAFHILVPERQLLCPAEVDELRQLMSRTNRYEDSYDDYQDY